MVTSMCSGSGSGSGTGGIMMSKLEVLEMDRAQIKTHL
jgi:hypothetical protein